MKFVECTQGSEEWLQARAGVTTASMFHLAIETTGGLDDKQKAYVDAVLTGQLPKDAAVLAGYKAPPTAEVVKRALAGLPVTEPSPGNIRLAIATALELISKKPYGDTFETFAMRRGREQEGFARIAYEGRHSVIVDEAGLALTDDSWFGYSTDGFVELDGMIEIKVPKDPLKIIAILETGDLSEYLHQIQGGMWITGRKWCDFIMGLPELACLNNGNEIWVKRVYRDDDFIEKMELALLEHRHRVQRYEKLLRTPFGQKAVNDELMKVAA